MGYKVRREIRDALPPGLLTTAERLVLLEIADLAGDDTRVAKFGPDQVALLVDMTASAVRKHVQRIGHKGIDLRIQIGTDGRGLPVYAHAGMQTNYRIPILTVSEGGQPVQAPRVERVDNPSAEGGQPVQRGWTEKAERVDGLSTPSPHVSSKNFPQSSSSGSAAVSLYRELTGAEEEEAELILKNLRAERNVRAMLPYLRGSDPDDLKARLADHRAAIAAAAAAKSARPKWCGKCSDGALRRIYESAAPNGDRPCDDCNQDSPVFQQRQKDADLADSWARAAANPSSAARPRNGGNGWQGPYLNPTDPNAYDDYQLHGVETQPRRPSATDRAIAEGLAIVAQLEEQERLGGTFQPAIGAAPHDDHQ